MLCGNAFALGCEQERRLFQCIKTFTRITTQINIVNTIHENFGCCEVYLGSIGAKWWIQTCETVRQPSEVNWLRKLWLSGWLLWQFLWRQNYRQIDAVHVQRQRRKWRHLRRWRPSTPSSRQAVNRHRSLFYAVVKSSVVLRGHRWRHRRFYAVASSDVIKGSTRSSSVTSSSSTRSSNVTADSSTQGRAGFKGQCAYQ